MRLTSPLAVALALTFSSSAAQYPPGWTAYPNTDITPCAAPCQRVGNCGYGFSQPCNITAIIEICSQTCGCIAVNDNGWLKGCGNTTCGAIFEASSGTTTVVFGDGMPPPTPDSPVAPIDDVHFPAEEPSEASSSPALTPSISSASTAGQWAVLVQPGGGSSTNVTAGQSAFGFVFLAVVAGSSAGGGSAPVVVLEKSFERWGFVSYISSSASVGEVARLRKGTGATSSLNMPNYNALITADCLYYSKVAGQASDWLGNRILNDTMQQANFTAAIKYLPPQRDYASIGGIVPYQKYSVSPDARIKAADDAIYTTDTQGNQTGPGTLVFDPALFLPQGWWPETNWTQTKSALVGDHLRVVSVIGYDPSSTRGFEQVAFAPASEPSYSAYVRLRTTMGTDAGGGAYKYYNVSKGIPAVAMDIPTYYAALFAEQAMWNATFSSGIQYMIPGQEGKRQIDMARGAMVASASLYVDMNPNYGDGQDYWSPQVDRGASLPFQTIALNQALLDAGLWQWASDRLGYWFDNYIYMPQGNISTGDWEDSCPNKFADGLADYGEMQDIFVRVARTELAYNMVNETATSAASSSSSSSSSASSTRLRGPAWLNAHFPQFFAMANYSYNLRLAALASGAPVGDVTHGLIFGSPEHDTCHSPNFYYHNNAWFIRGLIESGKFIRDVCPTYCPAYAAYGQVYLDEAASFLADFQASLALSVIPNPDGSPFFIPPIAQLNATPFQSMVESVLAEYSNFRYYSELLGADILSPELAIALQDFRENTFGTVSGITRWSDHLDDMPSSYYLATSLRSDRIPRFLLLQYGHMANYHGRGTFTATEQLPMTADSMGFSRDYLWSYLEGGIDQCIPSIMLPSIATRWQFVYERYDEDVLYINRGAPRRWFDPTQNGFSARGALTRYGLIDMSVSNGARSSGDGEDSTASIIFTLPPGNATNYGITTTPQFAIRLLSSNAEDVLQASTVQVSGNNAVLVGVDSASNTIFVNVTAAGKGANFFVAASFTH